VVVLHSTDSHAIYNYEWRNFALVFNVVNMIRANVVGNVWLFPEIVIEI